MAVLKKRVKSDLIQWSVYGPGEYIACTKTVNKLEAGLYGIHECQQRIIFKDRGLQTDDLIEFPDSLPGKILKEINEFWSLEHEFKRRGFLHRRGYLLHGPPGGGKALSLDSLIKVPNGWKRMGDMQVGDIVCTPDGKVAPVTGVFPQGIKDVYRITLEDDRYTECCEEHLWKVYGRNWRNTKTGAERVKSLKEIMDYGKLDTLFIPLPEKVYNDTKALPLDPYVLGCLLGDATIRGVKLSNIDFDLLKTVTSKLEKGYCLKKMRQSKCDYNLCRLDNNRNNKGHVPKKNNFLNFYKKILFSLNLLGKHSWEKFIPDIYKEASYEQRLELVQGLMDTDGTATDGRTSYNTSSHRLALDMQYMIRSLGGLCSITPRKTFYTYKGEKREGRTSYRLSIRHSTPDILFKLDRKKNASLRKRKIKLRNRIKSIVYSGKKECQCIMVDHPDHLYITDNFVVTHNTCLIKQLIQLVVSKGDIVLECRQPSLLTNAIKQLREIEPNRHIMCIFEDIDAICSEYGESRLLSLLDGENQIDKVVMVASTNYPERLDKRIKNRPRRFDRMCFIGMPNDENRKIYFTTKLLPEDLEKHPIDQWVEASNGFSYAALADLIISVTCIKNSFGNSVQQLKNLMKEALSDEYYKKGSGLGFNKKAKEVAGVERVDGWDDSETDNEERVDECDEDWEDIPEPIPENF